MNNPPLLSVIVLNYNGGEYLKTCLDTIAHQDLEDVEIIVADGKSTDDSIEILEEYKKTIPLIVYSEEDKGINDAFRKSLTRVRGQFVCNMCSTDGYADPNWFKTVKNICADNQIDAIFSTTALNLSEDGSPIGVVKPWLYHSMALFGAKTRYTICRYVGIVLPDMGWVIRRSTMVEHFPAENNLEKYGVYAPFLGFLENIFLHVDNCLVLNKITSLGRIHPGSRTIEVARETRWAKLSFKFRMFASDRKTFFEPKRWLLWPFYNAIYFALFCLYGGLLSMFTSKVLKLSDQPKAD